MAYDEKTTIRLSTEQQEYCNRNNINVSELARDAINARMRGDNEKERVRKELEEKRENLEDKRDEIEQIEAQVTALESRLEDISSAQAEPVDDLIDKLSRVKRNLDKFNELEDKRLDYIASNSELSITVDDLRACLDYAVDWDTEEARLGEWKIAPDAEFADDEEERAREFISEHVR